MKLLFLLNIFIVMNCHAQKIMPISDDNFGNANFDNLYFFKDDLKDVRIIGLGESSHFMGQTYTAKIKMVKYLHENCGFDVLAFESPLYNLSKVNDELEKNILTAKDMQLNISGVWNTSEMDELFKYIIETRKTKRPLIYAGFDESFFNSSSIGDIKKDYSIFIDSLKIYSKKNIVLDSVFYQKIGLVAEKSYSFSKQSGADTLYLNNKFKEIKDVLKDIDFPKSIYFDFWKRITDNLESVYRKKYSIGNRDLQMANNVFFLAEEKYPDKKIMLWAATTHLLYSPLEISTFKIDKKLNSNKMGVYLREKYKNQYYLLAYTALQGKIGFKGYLGLGKNKIKSSTGSIEKFISEKYDTNYAFISLKSNEIRKELELNKIFKSNLWGAEETVMNIENLVDGIFYVKNEHVVNLN